MPATFCIPKNISQQIKDAIRSKTITAQGLYDMSAEQRKTLFSTYMGDEGGAEIANKFEGEMVERQNKGISAWINKNTDGNVQAQEALDRMKLNLVVNPKGLGLEKAARAIVEDRNGVALSEEEISTISNKANKLQTLGAQKTETGSLPPEFYDAKADLNNYVYSIAPAKTGKSLLSLSKDNILLSLPSAAKNALGNFESNIVGKVARRGGNLLDAMIKKDGDIAAVKGMNNDVVNDWKKESLQIYNRTGLNRGRTVDMDTAWATGDTKREVTGTGTVAKVARYANDNIMKYLHGEAHVVNYLSTMGDTVNLEAKKVVMKAGYGDEATTLAAHKDLVNDALSEAPKTPEGQVIRAKAQEQAAYYANLNDSEAAQSTRLLKAAVEKVAGKTTADFLLPIVKAPANIVSKTIDYAGGSLVKGVVSGTQQILAGETEAGISAIVKGAASTGIAWGMADLLAHAIGPDNYQGVPTNQQQTDLMNEKGAKPYSVRIGGKWVSLAAFIYIAPELAGTLGALQAQQKGEGVGNQATNLVEGFTGKVADDVPGVTNLISYYENASGQQGSPEDVISNVASSFYSRIVPGATVLSSIAKLTDSDQRQTKNQGLGAHIKEEIPGLRESLPAKTTESGKVETNSPALSFLLGSNVTDDQSTTITNEIQRLGAKGYNLDLTTPENDTKFQALLSQQGQSTYKSAVDYYNNALSTILAQTINGPSYKNMTVDRKKAYLEKIHTDVVDATVEKYGYTKPLPAVVTEQ